MIDIIIPILSSGIVKELLLAIKKTRESVKQLSEQADFLEFTDHSIKHSDNVVKNVESIAKVSNWGQTPLYTKVILIVKDVKVRITIWGQTPLIIKSDPINYCCTTP